MRISLVMLWLFTGCSFPTEISYSGIDKDFGGLAMSMPQDQPGKQLMENNCYLCHNPKASEKTMIAPPMFVVKDKYLTDGISKEEFIETMVSWIKNPDEETSKMPEAIKKYGMMPYQFYPESNLRKIAAYMFDNEIEKPEWLQE